MRRVSEVPGAEKDAWCPCGIVDDRGDGTCGSCGLRIMTENDEARRIEKQSAPTS